MRYDHKLTFTSIIRCFKKSYFFDDVRVMFFTLHPIEKSIANLEFQNCTLSDVFTGLASKLLDTDHLIKGL